ncbi:helix-turn-helix transcriptional regulator [Klebsiella variicola]
MPSKHYDNENTIHVCLESIARVVPVTACAFYQVSPKLLPQHYVLHQMSEQLHNQYLNVYQCVDPLLPHYFSHGENDIIGINQPCVNLSSDYYQGFMKPNAIRDITEIFIRRGGSIVAGVTMLRDTFFTHKEHAHLRALLPLIELAIGNIFPDESFNTVPSLTEKEREIIAMLRSGASNKRIAIAMGISLSTVKTHMRNIFEKTEVTNRTELVSLFYFH